MKDYTYTVIVMPSWSGHGYRAVCPLIPKFAVRAETKAEAVRKMKAKLSRRLDRKIECGEAVCDPRCCVRPLH